VADHLPSAPYVSIPVAATSRILGGSDIVAGIGGIFLRNRSAMLIFIPPSEGKIVPGDAEPVDIGSLVLPGLAATRAALVESLAALSSGPRDEALSALGLTGRQAGELEHNRRLAAAPAAPAAHVYAGVLYGALDLPGLQTHHSTAYHRAQESVLVFSGLWGVVRPDDRIPHYRCPAGVKLPGIGSVAAAWAAALDGPLTDLVGGRLVVDLRSTAYAGLWRPDGRLPAVRTVTARIVNERESAGVVTRTVVSHSNKATKGKIVRDLLLEGAEPKTPEEFADTLRCLGYTVQAARPGVVDVIVAEA
jgi:cytoplasmic iron level regulating protein YaaA (DUF328/UPF0246 family)